jgi:predicted metal-dependent phosphoesterase TrpH
MLKFMRNKLVSIELPSDDIYVAYGFLDDHIYSLETTFQVNGADMCIDWIEGRWNRYTTPDCPRALGLLGEAKGLCLTDKGFRQSIHKIVGRRSCRHFANIILECADAICKTRQMLENRPDDVPAGAAASAAAAAAIPEPATAPETQPVQPSAPNSEHVAFENLEDAPEGFFLDLHVHTAPASPCASSGVDDVIAEAKRIGLDGICLTDHNHRWSAEDVEALRRKYDYLVLQGNEITTVQGDIVVLGLHEDIQGIIALRDLAEKVRAVNGFMIAAHPFRGFLAVGGDKLGLDVDRAAARPMFSLVDGMETLNSKVTVDENRFCGEVAQALHLPVTGGSDAHLAEEVGAYATRFSKRIRSEAELIAALKAGDGVPVAFRKQK